MYFFYSYFGYNNIYRIYSNKSIDFAILNPKGYSFIGKRLCMLSHLTLLYSAFYLEYSNMTRYLNVLALHFVVNCGYYVKWGMNEYSTFYMHVFWTLPIFIHGSSNFTLQEFYITPLNSENLYLIYFLLFYCAIHKKIYTPRIKLIDNPD